MSILKYLERAKRMDDLIRRKATGNSVEFAKKLGISRSLLMIDLHELKELGAPIQFDDQRQSYVYSSEFRLFLSEKGLRQYLGGYAQNYLAVQYDWTL